MSVRSLFVVAVKREFKNEARLHEIFRQTGINAVLEHEESRRALTALTRNEIRVLEKTGMVYIEPVIEFTYDC